MFEFAHVPETASYQARLIRVSLTREPVTRLSYVSVVLTIVAEST